MRYGQIRDNSENSRPKSLAGLANKNFQAIKAAPIFEARLRNNVTLYGLAELFGPMPI
jgi:hypothetical protein